VAGDAPAGVDAEKKTLAASERKEEERAAWRQAIATRDAAQFVFVDETSTHTSLTRLYAWAPPDQRAVGQVPRNHGRNLTLVAGLSPSGLRAPWVLEGAMDTLAFGRYIEEVLGPTVRPGQVVIVDNLSVHKGAAVRDALRARGCELVFLPAYSPDCTPIEQAFSKVKAILRGLGARTREALLEAADQAVSAITRADATAWFTSTGYALPAPTS
jgi:transposase